MEPIVARLHEALIDALNASRPGWLDSPVTIAEIYQDLVPYRQVRGSLGIDLNADYEFALLQLLAGAGELVRVEPAEAREELRREAAAPNPNLGVYRRFAGCDAWVAPIDLDAPYAAPPGQEPGAPSRVELDEELEQWVDDAHDVPFEREPDPEWEPSAAAPEPSTGSADEPEHAATSPAHGARTSCSSCGAVFPAGRRVRYCPFCGTDQDRRTCNSCGEVVESGWRFCIACGAMAPG